MQKHFGNKYGYPYSLIDDQISYFTHKESFMETTKPDALTLYVGFGGKYVSLYCKPLSEAKETDRVCRLPRTPDNERLALAMASARETLDSLKELVLLVDAGTSADYRALQETAVLRGARSVIGKASSAVA